MGMAKTAIDMALKHKIRLGRFVTGCAAGHYYISGGNDDDVRVDGTPVAALSLYKTAKSAIIMMKKHLNQGN